MPGEQSNTHSVFIIQNGVARWLPATLRLQESVQNARTQTTGTQTARTQTAGGSGAAEVGPAPLTGPGSPAGPGPSPGLQPPHQALLFHRGGCSFGAAAIWQYESLKSRVQNYFDELQANWLEKLRPQKQGDLRKEINEWWNSLTEGQKTVAGIIFANILVFLAWPLVPPPIMLRYFTSNPASSSLCLPMLLSTFSHMSLFHLAANMYVLWSFSSSAVSMLGREQFLAVYLSAAVTSSFSSYLWKTATGRCVPSVGASGAIMAVLALVCTKMPEAKLAIIFLPMFTFTAANALKAIVVMDTAGLLLRWRFFDHAAHLGGALFGIWYILFGHELIWKNREPLVKLWHDLRTQSGGRPGGPGGAV
ncbi:presenilins-associated rhomboid-like protein, mitochondrial isoform X2 [Poeciliopsis prolifica]|uniref:presenilins-associated rhomboid-like protein, mitochondrial isoform X2 n=1 Tax=Poeciliopsis prolifica TaxID=188132 RepID=UPI0024136281|nr:presenilins-associated rhomboid-like protein, mitochondrial isoform X2 [Poeciliopsis prolifica]